MSADHLYLELTSRCNLACRHCYLSAGPQGEAALSASVVLGALGDFAAAGGQSLTLSGGEPLLHPAWAAVAARGVELGLHTTLATNGTLIDAEALRVILRLRLTVALSIDGEGPATHDAVRGQGAWARTMEGLHRLVAADAGSRVIACFTPNGRNVGELWPLAIRLRDMGVSHLYISPLEDRGRERLHRDELGPSVEDQISLLVQIALLQSRLDLAMDIDAGHLKYFFHRLWHERDGLGDPIEGTLRVSPEGNVYFTAYSDDPRMLLGDIADLGHCWESEKVRALLEEATRRREGVAECGQCPYWIVCGGGSPIRAFATNGTFQARDEFCEAKYGFLERWFRAQ